MSQRVGVYVAVMMWLTLAASLWRNGFDISAVIIAACAGFNTGIIYQSWAQHVWLRRR